MSIDIPERFRHGLGRIQNHDPKNWDYPVKLEFMKAGDPPRTVVWRYYGHKLWQRNIGACTGFQGAMALNTQNMHTPGRMFRNQHGFSFYAAATARDKYPGTWYLDAYDLKTDAIGYHGEDTGSDAGAVGDVLIGLGYIKSYRWARGVDGAIEALQDGPLGFGSVWTYDMFYPDSKGEIRPTGRKVGGHQYHVVGWHEVDRMFKILCAWNDPADPWGYHGTGYAYMSEASAAILLEQWEGDVCQYEVEPLS